MKDRFASRLGISATSVRLLTASEFISWQSASKVEFANYGVSQA